MLIGTLKLASLVQYVPLPVVGGYLGYVGYFCLASGVSLASGTDHTLRVALICMLSRSWHNCLCCVTVSRCNAAAGSSFFVHLWMFQLDQH